ncbi:MAG: glycosyltransferase, partial [Polyangiaceae bacterium]|nr:glycosyltransferase [Polyangiaceae bacterium]
VLARGEYDALIVQGYAYITALMSLVAPRRRTRVLFRGESNLQAHRPMTTLALKKLGLTALFRRVDHFLAIGSLNREYYAAYGVPAGRVTMAPYSVDDRFFHERSRDARRSPAEVRRRLGLPERGTLFVSVGKLIPIKRPFDLLEAFARADIADRAALAYVGDGRLLGELQARTRELGLEGAVKFLGFRNQTELPEIYGASDVIVLPSESETWGLAVNEAMACGAAAFVSDRVGAAPDLVGDPERIFGVGNVERLAQMIRRASDDGDWLQAIKRASATCIERWNMGAAADGILAGVERALGSPVESPPAARLDADRAEKAEERVPCER